MTATSASPWRKNLGRALLLCVLSALLIACETVAYYSQAARGQLQILMAREEIHALLATGDLDPRLRAKLELVLAARQFASEEIGLPAGENYLSYVDLEREHAVWNVFAAPEFSVDPLTWCYPIAGCVAYRGYFSESGAIGYAKRLEDDGYDVYLGGVDAFSTLGWFDDPLFSTVINRSDTQLAGLIFHELAHQLLYVPGDTTFNESFATVVEREGMRRWLEGAGADPDTEPALRQNDYQRQFVELVLNYREQFTNLYRENLAAGQMRQRKQALQDAMRSDYESLKMAWSGYSGYDAWFAGSLNNAQLSTVGSYNDLVAGMEVVLREEDGDLDRFYGRMQALSELDMDARHGELAVSAPGDGG